MACMLEPEPKSDQPDNVVSLGMLKVSCFAPGKSHSVTPSHLSCPAQGFVNWLASSSKTKGFPETTCCERSYFPCRLFQIRMIRKKMIDIMAREAASCDLKDLVAKFIPEAIGKEIEKSCQGE